MALQQSTPTPRLMEPHVLSGSKDASDDDHPRYLLPIKRPPRNASIADLFQVACYYVPDAEVALSFYESAFGAFEFCFEHVFKPLPFAKEISLFGRCVLLKEDPDWTHPSWDVPAGFWKVEDADATVTRAIRAGAFMLHEVKLIPLLKWRVGSIRDPFGYDWRIYEEVESLTGLKALLKADLRGNILLHGGNP